MAKPKLHKTKYEQKKERWEKHREKRMEGRKVKYPLFLFFLLFFIFLGSILIRYIEYKNVFFRIGTEVISHTEFNYYNNYCKNSWIDNNEEVIEETGLDITGDFSEQQYNETWTWEDFFDYETVNLIQQSRIFSDAAKKEDFHCDEESQYETFEQQLRDSAEEEGITLTEYIRNQFGEEATISEIETIVTNQYLAFWYYDQLQNQETLTDEELDEYYFANSSDYDSVDYRFFSFHSEDYANARNSAEEFESRIEDEDSFTDLCVEFAVENKEQYEDPVYSTATNVTKNQLSDEYRTFLYSSREEGDHTIIYNEEEDSYDVVYFLRRYLDDYDVFSFRQIYLTDSDRMNQVLEEWENSDQTEETFSELATTYSEDTDTKDNGGLYEDQAYGSMVEPIQNWLYNQVSHQVGDYDVIDLDEGQVLIYITEIQEAEWKESARETYQSNYFSEWFDHQKEIYDISDPNGNLEYRQKFMEPENSEN